jgi:hypothetical protein
MEHSANETLPVTSGGEEAPIIEGGGNDLDMMPQGVLDEIAKQIRDDIDEACRLKGEEESPREHLGASVIGDDCSRRVWYEFRWVKFETFSGRMHRLFARGHAEEAKIIGHLRSIGFTVWDLDPATGKQFRVYGASGHTGGAKDGVATAPLKYKLPKRFLLEFKTHNSQSFVKLTKDRVKLSKPRHYAQMCSYGAAYGYDIGLYCAVNKNDDDLYFELVRLDHKFGTDMARKADDIVRAYEPPPKVSMRKDHWECKMCYLSEICHGTEPYAINCRSCAYAEPQQGGEWFCHNYKQKIPAEYIPQGCQSHVEIGRR